MTGRHRGTSWWRSAIGSPVALLSTLLVVVLAAWAGVSYFRSASSRSSCTNSTPVHVVAAPAVAPAVEQIVRAGARLQPCASITVEAQDSATIAARLTQRGAGAVRMPDAWLPESTLWLRRARDAGAFEVPERGTSVASSPVVLAMTEQSADRLGWPAKPVDWASLLGPDAPGASVAIPDPAADPVGVTALLGIRALAAGKPEPAAAVLATMRRIAKHTLPPAADAGAALPPQLGTPGSADAFATTEQALVRHNRLSANKLVGAYATGGVPSMDWPYVVLPQAQGAVRDAATSFLDALLSASARATFGDHGFRAAGGLPPGGFPTDHRVRLDAREPVALAPEETVTELLNAWGGASRSARILTVIDISGSMAARVPGTADTRLGATIKAAQEGAGLLLDATEIGIWVFSTRLDGDRDYRSILPVAPLRQQRAELVRRLGEVQVKPNGATGLYDTTLAAYREARQHWTPGRINLVLVMTDGRNEDDQSIARAALLAELAKLQDPRRPLPILFIGLGADIDRDELERIAAATGGKVFITQQPSGIRQIFFSALADLACLPPDCRR